MRIGQTSLVVFLSKLLASALGFVSTIYFARVLGADILGVYAVVIALVAWLQLGARVGFGRAYLKRVSENKEQGEYLTAGTLIIGVLSLGFVIGLGLGHKYVEAYISDFSRYTALSVVWFVAALFILQSGTTIVYNTLKGQGLVHIFGLLQPVYIGLRSAFQIGFVFFGATILGLLVGNIIGLVIVTVIGLLFISIRPKKPEWRHFQSLFDYAKFSWLGSLKSRAFNDVDILILGAFVSSNLVGVYSVAWSITKFLDLFGGAISQAMFPQVSEVATKESPSAATRFIEDSLAYAGFITIPGLVGGFILSDRLFRIYGPEFVVGTDVFWLLLLSILIFSYATQTLNALNALDRPDLAFYANAVFIATNVCLNVVLIWQIGWVGAAIASSISSVVALIASTYLLTTVVTIDFPIRKISKQVISALVMGAVVLVSRNIIERTGILSFNVVIVLLLVLAGVGTYVLTLFGISPGFRDIVNRNLPIDLPYSTRTFEEPE